jgi:hypothetical protein
MRSTRNEMEPFVPIRSAHLHALSDDEIVRRVCAGETSVFEVPIRRYNQREVEEMDTAESADALSLSEEVMRARRSRRTGRYSPNLAGGIGRREKMEATFQ